MIPNLPTLGIRFDVDRIDSGSYGTACWRIFWEAVNPADISGSLLYEGDTAASIAGNENVFCIAIQNTSVGVLGSIKGALAQHAAFNIVCSPPRFVEGNACIHEPLVNAGEVSPTGAIQGDGWNSKPGLQAARPKP